ncbi:hypothetical protein FK004_16340 [Flavobacterium kingsejongi]|uniref:DUF805 domain-containing protein n=2 Tax=Flavobacterium kingsejongi TaxID=1678728 RepID=A0A2S1LSN1_9FLAO|nr:hypothetical protein FK004_16340 [Flavobacterium kingsejongi]
MYHFKSNSFSMKNIKYIIVNTFNFRGVTGRKAYWSYLLVYYITLFILAGILGVVTGRYQKINNIQPNGLLFTDVYVYYSILLLPMVSATVRRLRDAGLSPWLVLVPVLNVLLSLKASKKEARDLRN